MIELGVASGPAPEIRTDATQIAIDVLTAAIGATTVNAWAAGAVECAAGLWARSLSTATITPDGAAPIGTRWLAEVGRDLARRGEVVYLVDVAPRGRLRLLRASAADVSGDGPDPADWWYRLTVTGPRTTRTVTAPAGSVVHVRYATEPHSPARGVSPLAYASLTGRLGANLERSLGYEAGGAVGRLIALPEGHQNPAGLADAIRTADGRTLLPETVAGGWGDKQGAPKRDWKPERLGADPPTALVQLRQHVESTVLSCFGIGAPLGPQGWTDGTAAREAARRLWTLTVQPLGDLIAEELTRVLERPVRLEYGRPSGMADSRRPGAGCRGAGEGGHLHGRRAAADGLGRCLTPWTRWPIGC